MWLEDGGSYSILNKYDNKIPVAEDVYKILLREFNDEEIVMVQIFVKPEESSNFKSQEKESTIYGSSRPPLVPISLHYYTDFISENFEDRKKFHFLNIGYDGLEFEENSVVFVNDWAISSEHTENVWQKLNNNCHLISTKIINAQPQDKITVVTENNIQLTYYYYIKKCEPITAVSKYQKTFVINLDDCQHSEKRWQLLKEKFNYFNNVERFSASKGRVEDYQLYVGDRWDWGSFTGRQSHIVRMTDGEVGCCMSHIRIWKKIVEDDIDVCLVVEDDANKILPGFDLILSNLINKLPKDWDVFIIGFMLFRDKGELVSDDFLKIKEFLLTHCYLINKKGAQKFLENLQVDSPIDTFMTRCSDKVNIYSHNYFRRKDADKMYPALISQSSKEPGVLSLITKFQGRV
jgi:GR25 family glycosyltransferase involved in LPS biosynthesis